MTALAPLHAVVGAPAFICNAASRIFGQTEPANNLLRIVTSCLDIHSRVCNIPVLSPLYDTCKVVNSYISAKSFIGKTNDIISGKTAAENPDYHLRISENIVIPDILAFVSKSSLLIADLCGAAKLLDSAGIISFAQTSISTATISTIQPTFAVVGFLADLAVTCRKVADEGFTVDLWLKIGSTVAKLAFFALIGSDVPVLVTFAFVAGATSSVCYLARFLKKEYGV